MSRSLVKSTVILLMFVLMIGSVYAQNTYSSTYTAPKDNFDLNAIVVDGELYIWNRISDLFDLVRGGLALGPGLGAEVAITDYAKIGAYANAERGVTFPHFVFPFWMIDYYEKNTPLFIEHYGSYATACIGPWRAESRTEVTETAYFFPRDRWDIRVQLDAALLHACVTVSPLEFWDFLAGIAAIDPSGDDMRLSRGVTRKPADQFGRGLCNLAFGVLEVPKTIFLINHLEGDLPAASKGVALGVWRFLCREVVGAIEFVTFPFGWQPIIEPTYVISNDKSIVWRISRPAFQKTSDTTNTWNN